MNFLQLQLKKFKIVLAFQCANVFKSQSIFDGELRSKLACVSSGDLARLVLLHHVIKKEEYS
jgi:hypothetical protein